MSVNRRTFLTLSAAGVLGAWTITADGVAHAVPLHPDVVPGVLPAGAVRKYAAPLVLPGAMPRTGRQRVNGRPVDYYEIATRQVTQQILPPELPATEVWAYGSVGSRGRGHGEFHTPGLTVHARSGEPVRIRWSNELTAADGTYLPHLLPVDPTLHWANPPREPGHGGVVDTDLTPDFAGRRYVAPEDFTDPATQYTAYDGPVPLIPHLHGADGVSDASDGHPEAWFLPDAVNIPEGYGRHGRWYEHLEAKARAQYGARWRQGVVDFDYPNVNRACTLWAHDHALGLTRLNVYAGPVLFYLLDDDATVTDARTGRAGTLPQNRGANQYDLCLAIQDRAFYEDGSQYYPDSREFFDPDYEGGPWYPESPINPIWVPEFFGNTLTVNGRTWPFHQVERRRYRLRFLNACNARTLYLDFRDIPGARVHLIGNDGGFIGGAPVDVMAQEGWRRGRLVIAPAERLEVLLDFSEVPAGRHVLRNVGPDGFFGGGEPEVDFGVADPNTTGQIMAFDVVRSRGRDQTTPGEFLRLPGPAPRPEPVRTRRLATTMHFHHLSTEQRPLDPPVLASATMLGVIHGEPGGEVHIQEVMWSDPITENPGVGDVEDWVFYNIVQDVGIPHPMHVHQGMFEIMERGTFRYDMHGDYTRGVLTHTGTLPLDPEDEGHNDTAFVYPGTYMRVRLRHDYPGVFSWHCHLLEHEDNEMMRPYRVGPPAPGEPEPIPHPHGGGHGGGHGH
ncbi:MAG: multicopper oxidase domain-containing protein [Micrococcus sp.]|nr:multicopper oxidase domain-containing protein [Micrococcus sp.]